MEIEKKYLSSILRKMIQHPSSKIVMVELAIQMGAMQGSLDDTARITINQEELDKFLGHIKYLYEGGILTSSDRNLGENLNKSLNVINSSITYQLTNYGYEYESTINKGFFKKIKEKASKTSGKITWLVIGGVVTYATSEGIKFLISMMSAD